MFFDTLMVGNFDEKSRAKSEKCLAEAIYFEARGEAVRGQIAVAATDIELGGRITPEMVRMVDWPQASTPPGAFANGADLAGRVVLAAVRAANKPNQ